MTIDWTKPIQGLHRQRAEVIRTLSEQKYRHVVFFDSFTGERILVLDDSGVVENDFSRDPWVQNVPEAKPEVKVWRNKYGTAVRERWGFDYETKSEAEKRASPNPGEQWLGAFPYEA